MEFYLFDRTDKIIHFDDLSILNGAKKIEEKVKTVMSQNEVFVLQIASLGKKDDIVKDVKCISDGLSICCINTEVVDKFGRRSTQSVMLKSDRIQPFFFTVEAQKKGLRSETAVIEFICESGTYSFAVEFEINDNAIKNHGYDDIKSLSRIKWLNSTFAEDDSLVKPYTPVKISGNCVSVLGRDMILANNGLVSNVLSKFDESIELCDEAQKELFKKPCEFVIREKPLECNSIEFKGFKNRAEVNSTFDNSDFYGSVKAVLRYDGQLEYSVKITPKKDFVSDNVSLNFYVNNDCTSLMHGLGHRASKACNLNFKWDIDKQQDCIFIGTVNCGMRVKFKAENYRRPLINIFYKNLPLVKPETTWDNYSKGGIYVRKFEDFVKLSAETGRFEFKENETRSFDFEIHVTPLKPFDYKKAFKVRYSHSNRLKNEYKEIDEAAKNGLNYVIFHQGNMIMPYINYPFYETDRLKKAVEYAKSKNIGIKLYYTEREHSNHMAETFVYKALGDEIVLRKKGVSHSWQKEKPQWLVDNFGEDIIPGWFVKYKHGKYKNEHDISFIVRPDTRLDNYYIEGLNWLIENIGISGIYIDDTSLDRTTLERAKKLLDKKDGLIDMHMWNHEEPRAGDVSCLNLYCELLPFLDSIWLGEGFFYKKYSPEYMLSEVSGIPYGVPGQMLQDGGDLYEGMLYAMNNRYGWGYKNSKKLYDIWDDFGIESSKMLGYWHSKNPVRTTSQNVLATVYLKGDSALFCLYNFSKKKQNFALCVNDNLLGFRVRKVIRIKIGSKTKRQTDIEKTFSLSARSGMMLLLKK